MKNAVRLIELEEVEKIELPNDSWSRMVLNEITVGENRTSMGYSIFTPGTELAPVSHDCEELAIVIAGKGELRVEDQDIPFGPGDAMFIPAHTWHAVVNTGEEDVVMVFTFASPNYPPTERR